MNMQSDLGRVRGLGSAKEGTGHWWGQRVSAVALVPLSLWFIYAVVSLAGAGHGDYVQWIKQPATALMLVLLIGFTFYHMALGLEAITEDYVHGPKTRVVTLVSIKLASLLLAVSGILSVLKTAFTG